MKRVLALLALVVGFGGGGAAAQAVYQRGYFNDRGTYVAPTYRSTPDRSYNNNYSVRPNINPYTGRMGTRQPTWNDRPPRSSGSFRSYGRRR